LKQEKFLMRVDNNKEGRNLIHSMKRNLNSDSYRIVTKYSGPRPVGTSQLSTSRENAKSIRVYVESKLSATFDWKSAIVDGTSELRANQIRLTDNLEQELVEEKQENKVLEAKLTLITARVENSSKYGTFVKTVNSIATIS